MSFPEEADTVDDIFGAAEEAFSNDILLLYPEYGFAPAVWFELLFTFVLFLLL